MLLALFFLACAFYFGWRLSQQFKFIDSKLKAIGFTVFTGLFFSTWIALLLFWLVFAELNSYAIIASAVSCIVAGSLLPQKRVKYSKDSRTALASIALFLVLFSLLHANSIFYNEKGDLVSRGYVWNDGAAHLAYISSFAFGDNHPPEYPFLNGFKRNYPFLIDFLSAVLVAGGFGLVESIVIPNILLSFSLLAFAFFFTVEFSRKEWVGALVLVLFFLHGNYGSLKALEDISQGNLLPLDENYSHAPKESIHFLNITTSMFIPERGVLLGFNIMLLALWILYRALTAEDLARQKKELAFAGALAGLSPFAYTHFFIMLSLLAFFWIMLNPKKEWLFFIVPLVLLSLPQLAWISQPVVKDFFGFQAGWMHDNTGKNVFEIAFFWLKNLPLAVFLAPVVFLFLEKKQRVFVIPFVLLFLLANVVRFQPQDWDNVKMIVFPFFFFTILAAAGVYKLWNFKTGKDAKRLLRTALAVIVGFSILSGVLGVAWLGFSEHSKATLFPKRDSAVAEWVKENTPQKAVFITSGVSNHLVVSLAGRKSVMAFDGWAWSYGLEYWESKQASERMLKKPDCKDFGERKVDYVFYGPSEWQLTDNTKFFDENFEKAYDETFDRVYNFKIYRVKC